MGTAVSLHATRVGCCGCFACGHSGAAMTWVLYQATTGSAAVYLSALMPWEGGDASLVRALERRARCPVRGTQGDNN